MSHPLDGIWEKIRRADEHINGLDVEINTFLDSNIYRAVSEPNHDGREHSLKIIGPDPPLRFSVIAGEIIHHCRSALDQLIWQLVVANGGQPNRQHAFPVCPTNDDFKNACKSGKIKGISDGATALVESFQPYHNPKGFEWHPLWVLHDMDVTDKHRLLVVFVAQAFISEVSIDTGVEGNTDLVGIVPSKHPAKPTLHGTEVLRFKFRQSVPNAKLDGIPVVHIVFEKYGPVPNQPVMHCVKDLRRVAVGTIMKFVEELKQGKTEVI